MALTIQLQDRWLEWSSSKSNSIEITQLVHQARKPNESGRNSGESSGGVPVTRALRVNWLNAAARAEPVSPDEVPFELRNPAHQNDGVTHRLDDRDRGSHNSHRVAPKTPFSLPPKRFSGNGLRNGR